MCRFGIVLMVVVLVCVCMIFGVYVLGVFMKKELIE